MTAEVTRHSFGGAYCAAGGAERPASRRASRSAAFAPPRRAPVAAAATPVSGARRKGHVAVVWPGCVARGVATCQASARPKRRAASRSAPPHPFAQVARSVRAVHVYSALKPRDVTGTAANFAASVGCRLRACSAQRQLDFRARHATGCRSRRSRGRRSRRVIGARWQRCVCVFVFVGRCAVAAVCDDVVVLFLGRRRCRLVVVVLHDAHRVGLGATVRAEAGPPALRRRVRSVGRTIRAKPNWERAPSRRRLARRRQRGARRRACATASLLPRQRSGRCVCSA